MEKWERAYNEKKFSIKTDEPSLLVNEVLSCLKPNSRILDLGCGNGRNSIFLAKGGHQVDAIDVADLEFMKNIPEEIKKKINFSKGSVLREFNPDSYNLVIAARLLQYLSPNEVKLLIASIAPSIIDGGKLLISYNTAGGIFDRKDIQVEKYSHSIDCIETVLKENAFKNIDIRQGGNMSKYVPYEGPIKTFDIIATK